MKRYNLLDEPWISVLVDRTGKQKDVSMLELFQNAGSFRSLAGEMETQNFAVMRFLLAVLQTVFSRFDLEGNVLPGIHIDEKWRQTEPVDEDDDDYGNEVESCWDQLYKCGSFPDIVIRYLEEWRESFYLFHDEHPFYQVNRNEMDEIMKKIPKKKQPTSIYGKNLNRTISESENKISLFSPIASISSGKRSRKDIMSEAELARWLLTFQGYSGLADKVSLVDSGQRPSKGWLFDLGGIFLRGGNVFETLVMNYIPGSPNGKQEFSGRIQKPCWEEAGSEVVHRLCSGSSIDNLAELYTNWSRAVYIDPKSDLSAPVEIQVVKLPEIEHADNFIEPMTLWKWNENDPNKNHFTPKKHYAEQSLWRSFGIIAMNETADSGSKRHSPGIFMQYGRLAESAGSRWTDLVGVSMEDDGNATSWLPVDEIVDSFQINDLVITDEDPDGWIIRINDAVETTKEVISGTFRNYLRGICEIRRLKLDSPPDPYAKGFMEGETANMYALVDPEFKQWLSSIGPDDSKEEKIKSWNSQLRRLVMKRGEELFENSTARDLTGIDTEKGIKNIASVYAQFVYFVNKKLGKGGRA